MEEFGLAVSTELDFDVAVSRTRVALQSHGFGIISEMRLPPEVGGEGRRHLFMSLWQKTIGIDHLGVPGTDVGDHLACSVVVFEEGKATSIAVLDPTEGMLGWEGAELGREGDELGREARAALEKMLEAIP